MRRYEKCVRLALAFVGLISATGIVTATPVIAMGVTSSTSSAPKTATDSDAEFLKKIRAAGFPETQMSDKDAIESAHKIAYWLCDSHIPSIRNTVEGYLAEKYGITERDGPGGGRAFSRAALETYRGVSSGAEC